MSLAPSSSRYGAWLRVLLVMELGSVTHPSSELCSAGVHCRMRHPESPAVPFCSVEHSLIPRERLVLVTVAELSSEDGCVTECNSVTREKTQV